MARDGNRGSAVCQHEAIRSEEMSAQGDLRMQNILLKQQVEFLKDKLNEMHQNNKTLHDNNKLLQSVIENFISIKNIGSQQKNKNNVNNRKVVSYADRVAGEGKTVECKNNAVVTEKRKVTHPDVRLNIEQQKVNEVNVNVNREMEQDGNVTEVDGEKWKQVTYQKKKIRSSYPPRSKNELVCDGSKINDKQTTISGATKKKWLYVGRIAGGDVTEEEIENFLKNTDGLGNIVVKKLDTKGSNSAFSVGLPSEEVYKTVYSKEFWPAGVILREFSFKNFFPHRKR
ncbi:uncharacterized protein LOC123310057 [Coccinella septempunctata]|uniref:uncharacterized protein LOC123310057 n=1 Tax=Coccinella septempunctata TaxID=41139 RepID=UPI001D06CD9A|nr:uncharacterized protein LOC123310057 [Coccinella septempunctata]